MSSAWIWHQRDNASLSCGDHFDAHAVYTRRSPIGSHLFPCSPQRVLTVDAIIQCVEPKTRLSFGLLAKLITQKREFLWNMDLAVMFLKLRSGWFFHQAELPSLLISALKVPSLGSTVIGRFIATMNESDFRPGPTLPYLFGSVVGDSLSPPSCRLSQVPVPFLAYAPSRTTPDRPVRACAHFFRSGNRLRHSVQVGHRSVCDNEAKWVRFRYGSHACLPDASSTALRSGSAVGLNVV